MLLPDFGSATQVMMDEIILVDTDDTCAAIKDVFEDTQAIDSETSRSTCDRDRQSLRCYRYWDKLFLGECDRTFAMFFHKLLNSIHPFCPNFERF